MRLKKEKKYTKAVSCMEITDIAEIKSLFQALYNMLDDNGIFVFATYHPCFARPEGKYITPCVNKGEAIKRQPVMQNYYHRPLQDIFQTLIVMLFLSGKDESVIGTFSGILCGIQLIFVIGSLFPTEIALKKNFDEHGNRKKL